MQNFPARSLFDAGVPHKAYDMLSLRHTAFRRARARGLETCKLPRALSPATCEKRAFRKLSPPLFQFFFFPLTRSGATFRKLFLFVKREFRQLWARRALIAR